MSTDADPQQKPEQDGSPLGTNGIEWVQQDTEALRSPELENRRLAKKGLLAFIVVSTVVLLFGSLLARLAEYSALSRLILRSDLTPPSEISPPIGSFKQSAAQLFWTARMAANQSPESGGMAALGRALLLEEATEVRQYAPGFFASQDSGRSGTPDMRSIVAALVDDMRVSVQVGALGRAKQAASLAVAIIDTSSLSPTAAGNEEFAEQVNAALLVNAVMEKMSDAAPSQQVFRQLLRSFAGLEALPTSEAIFGDEDVAGTMLAWKHYVQGLELMREQKFGAAEKDYLAASALAAGRLRDIANLCAARAAFWGLVTGSASESASSVLGRLARYEELIQQPSLKDDVSFYAKRISGRGLK